MSFLEYMLFYIIPVAVIIVVVFFHQIMRIQYMQPCRTFLIRYGIDSKIVERVVLLSAVLSIWFAISQNLIATIKDSERGQHEFSSLVQVFKESKESHQKTLELIVNGKSRHFMGIAPIEFRNFSTSHIDLLIKNKHTAKCFELTKLFKLKDELERLNIAMPSIREMTGFSIDNSTKHTWVTLNVDLVAQSALSLYSGIDNLDIKCLTS